MKTHLALFLVVPLLTGCSWLAPLLTSEAQPWSMIQSVGGLRVDDPVSRPDGTVFLPVVCNVSGLQKITTEPTTMNSGLVVKNTTAKIEQMSIQIQILTCVVDKKHSALSKGVNLGRPESGTYQVEYLNLDGSTVPLREIEIK